MGKLKAIQVNTLGPGKYTDGDGLILLVQTNGSRSWVLKKTLKGKRREWGLGSVKHVSLAEARRAADEYRAKIRSGMDPKPNPAANDEAAAVPTFAEAAKTAHAEQEKAWRNGKHRAQWLTSLEAYAFPDIGDMSVDAVEGPAIRDLLAKIWLSKPETARRVRQRIGAVLDWAYAKGFRSSEAPMRSVSKGLPKQPKRDNHFAALPYSDAPALMQKLAGEDSYGRLALRFLIFTAARSGEVRLATWKEIDLDEQLWTIPASRMKAGKAHTVPLSPPAVGILADIKEKLAAAASAPLFPGISGKPMSDMTLTKVLRTATKVDCTVHGFRSTFRDWAAEKTSFPSEVVEVALAHAIPNKVEAAYRRTNYLEKRHQLMSQWANFLANRP